jgi:hypothetical protein
MSELEILRTFLIYSLENSAKHRNINVCMEQWNTLAKKAEAQRSCGCYANMMCPRCDMKVYMQKARAIFK